MEKGRSHKRHTQGQKESGKKPAVETPLCPQYHCQGYQEKQHGAEQKEKIQEIFKNNEERFKTLRKDMNTSLRDIRVQLNNEIKSVLTEDQQVKYEAMINQHHSQRKGELNKRKIQSDGQNKGEKR